MTEPQPADSTKERLYTPYRGVVAEGARIGFCVCRKCGATLLLDPDLKFDVLALHAGSHGVLHEYLAQAQPEEAPDLEPKGGPRTHMTGGNQ